MRLFTITFIIFTTFSTTVLADEKNIWAELSLGNGGDFIASTVNIKVGDEDSNWALGFGRYSDFQVLSYVENRENGQSADLKMNTIALTKSWSQMRALGYIEAGIGLGVARGTWGSNCSKESSPGGSFSSTNSHDVCDISDGTQIGIPFHASAVFGKYIGIGITARAFATKEGLHGGLMITIPLGDFTQ